MKYLVRSLKYLLYFAVIFVIITAIIYFVMPNHKGLGIDELFEPGAFPKIAILFAIISAVYPSLGFKANKLILDNDFSKYRDVIISTMTSAEYEIVSESEDEMVFRHTKLYVRASRMWEDQITFTRGESVARVDGPRKDTQRLVEAIYYNYRAGNW